MTVRRLRGKQVGRLCSFCPTRASWRGVYFTRFACNVHHNELKAEDAEQMRRDSYESEADYAIRY